MVSYNNFDKEGKYIFIWDVLLRHIPYFTLVVVNNKSGSEYEG